MMFTHLMLPGVLAAAALGLFGPHVPAGAGNADKDAAAAKPAEKASDKPAKKEGEKADAERPACMHCGATCGLVAVCICKPGTKKLPKTEYEAKCDPICVPCCGGPPWKGHRSVAGCTGCDAACHDAWVRQRKKLVVEKKDEEKPTIERKVAWVCRACDAGPAAGCTGCGDATPPWAGWWPSWLPHH